jgi:hypothetical protein
LSKSGGKDKRRDRALRRVEVNIMNIDITEGNQKTIEVNKHDE